VKDGYGRGTHSNMQMNISLQIIDDSVDFLCFGMRAPFALDNQYNLCPVLKAMVERMDNLHSLMLEKLGGT
jgi:hypothetical protein